MREMFVLGLGKCAQGFLHFGVFDVVSAGADFHVIAHAS